MFEGREIAIPFLKFCFGPAEHGTPVRHPNGDICKAGGYMNLELSEDLGRGYIYMRGICGQAFKVIYNRAC